MMQTTSIFLLILALLLLILGVALGIFLANRLQDQVLMETPLPTIPVILPAGVTPPSIPWQLRLKLGAKKLLTRGRLSLLKFGKKS
jgi:hypothetical protein